MGLSPLFSFHSSSNHLLQRITLIHLPGKEFLDLKEMALDFSAISDTTAMKFFTHSSTLSSLNDVLN